MNSERLLEAAAMQKLQEVVCTTQALCIPGEVAETGVMKMQRRLGSLTLDLPEASPPVPAAVIEDLDCECICQGY